MTDLAAVTAPVSQAWVVPGLTESLGVATSVLLEPPVPQLVRAAAFRPYPNHDSLQGSPWRSTILAERRLLMANYGEDISGGRLVFGDHYIPASDGTHLFVKSVLPARDTVKAAALVSNATGQNHITAIFMCAILALRYGLASYIIDDRGSGYSEYSEGTDKLSLHVSDFLRFAVRMPDLMRTFYEQDLPWATIGFCGGAMVQLATLFEHADALANFSSFYGMVPIAPIVALPKYDVELAMGQVREGYGLAQQIADTLMGVPGTERLRDGFQGFSSLRKLYYLTEYGMPRAESRERQVTAHLQAAELLARGLPVLENGHGHIRVRGFGEVRDPISMTAEIVDLFGARNYLAMRIDDGKNLAPSPRYHMGVFDPKYPLAIQALYDALKLLGLPI